MVQTIRKIRSLLVLLLLMVLAAWAPWMTREVAAARAVESFTQRWNGVADGCGLIPADSTALTRIAVIGAHLSETLPEPSVRVEYVNAAGQRERILNAIRYDPARQILDGVWIFETLGETGEVMDIYGRYDRGPTRYGGQRVWVVKKDSFGS